MGSGDSKQGHIHGSMFISLESNSVKSRGILHGSVHISLTEQLTNPVLYLIFKGNEITDFKTKHSSNRHTHYVRHLGKQSLCALKALLYQWADLVVLPGNFSFPFELKVPSNLLPSFHTFSNFGGFCQIKYSLRAQLHATDRQPLKFKVPISVFTNSLILPQEMYPESLSKDCSGHGSVFCCFKKEQAESKVSIERGTFGNLDHIDIHLDTNLSRFSANANRVRIEVNKILTMVANKKKSWTATQTVNMLTVYQRLEIKAFSGPQHFTFRVPIQSVLKNEHCYSISSELIDCYFILNVKLYTELYCCKCYRFDESSQAFVILPFQIPIPIIPPPIASEQWQAQVLPQSAIKPDNQDSNNQNSLIVSSITNKPVPNCKVAPNS